MTDMANDADMPAATPAPTVAKLRHDIFEHGSASRGDLDRLIDIGRAEDRQAGFSDLMAEVACTVMVHGADPDGYVTDADAAWLIGKLSNGGGLSNEAEFAAVRSVISYAISVPPALTAFAMAQERRAILARGAGAFVSAQDVRTLRAIAFAPTQGSSLRVTRESAEALFDIAHATGQAPNDASFPEMFAKTIGNYLIGVAFQGTAPAQEVRAQEAERDARMGFGGFLSAMFGGARADLATERTSTQGLEEEAYGEQNRLTERPQAEADHIKPQDADWVIDHLTREGELTPAEKRLLSFIKQEAPDAPPALAALFDKAA